jgi:hypothetical protein
MACRVLTAGLLLWLYCFGVLNVFKDKSTPATMTVVSPSRPFNYNSFYAPEQLRFFLTNVESEPFFCRFEDKKMKKGDITLDDGRMGNTPDTGAQAYNHSDEKPIGLLPRLVNSVEEAGIQTLIKDDRYCAQEKFDGRRLLVWKEGEAVNGINKKGNLVGLPRPLAQVVYKFQGDPVLDGEAVRNVYYAFDLLALNGKDIRSWTYRQRLTALKNLLFSQQQDLIKCAETAFTAQQKEAMLEQLRKQNKEGILFKRLDAPYAPSRPASGGS